MPNRPADSGGASFVGVKPIASKPMSGELVLGPNTLRKILSGEVKGLSPAAAVSAFNKFGELVTLLSKQIRTLTNDDEIAAAQQQINAMRHGQKMLRPLIKEEPAKPTVDTSVKVRQVDPSTLSKKDPEVSPLTPVQGPRQKPAEMVRRQDRQEAITEFNALSRQITGLKREMMRQPANKRDAFKKEIVARRQRQQELYEKFGNGVKDRKVDKEGRDVEGKKTRDGSPTRSAREREMMREQKKRTADAAKVMDRNRKLIEQYRGRIRNSDSDVQKQAYLAQIEKLQKQMQAARRFLGRTE
jgi:DNA polymerase III delta prime subunit